MTATTQGKAAALKALAERRAQFKDTPRVNNAAYPAYSPMYFRCMTCGDPQGICVPEGWLHKPDLCEECLSLQKLGWLE